MKKAIGTIESVEGEMVLFYNGAGKCITGEKEDLVEELGYNAKNLTDAKKAVKSMYGGWAGWKFKAIR